MAMTNRWADKEKKKKKKNHGGGGGGGHPVAPPLPCIEYCSMKEDKFTFFLALPPLLDLAAGLEDLDDCLLSFLGGCRQI